MKVQAPISVLVLRASQDAVLPLLCVVLCNMVSSLEVLIKEMWDSSKKPLKRLRAEYLDCFLPIWWEKRNRSFSRLLSKREYYRTACREHNTCGEEISGMWFISIMGLKRVWFKVGCSKPPGVLEWSPSCQNFLLLSCNENIWQGRGITHVFILN